VVLKHRLWIPGRCTASNRVEYENDIRHHQTSLQRKKDGILGNNSNNRKGVLNCLWSDPGKLINGYVNS